MSPLISVIVPVYNVENYLEQCIKSIINQTYKNLEILLIDDGSTDKSVKIIDNFAKKFDKVFAYHKKNSGLGLTRNFGLKKARGEFVTFVDSDDFLDYEAIQKLVNGLEKGKNDTVIGGYTKVNNKGERIYVKSFPEITINKDQIYRNIFCKMLGSRPKGHNSIKPSVWNVLYSMKIIKKNSLHFVSERKLISEDIVWDADYYMYARHVKIIKSVGYYYRFNPKSLSHIYNPDRFKKIIYFFEYMTKRLYKSEIEDEARLRLTKNLFINVRFCLIQIENMSFKEVYVNVGRICRNKVLFNVINEYPIDKLELKQRIFVLMIKYKCIFCLTALTKMQLINKNSN